MSKLKPSVPVLTGEQPTRGEVPAYVPDRPAPSKLLVDILVAARQYHKRPTELFDALRKAAAWQQDFQAFYETDVAYKILVGEPLE